jgi:hypothetical protein
MTLRLAVALACTPLLVLGIVHATTQGTAGLAPMAEYREGDARVELYAEAGPCVGNARWAVFLQGPVRVPGCWLLAGDSVQIAWLDGDFSKVPTRVFRKPEIL